MMAESEALGRKRLKLTAPPACHWLTGVRYGDGAHGPAPSLPKSVTAVKFKA